jgi:hypothetical protein
MLHPRILAQRSETILIFHLNTIHPNKRENQPVFSAANTLHILLTVTPRAPAPAVLIKTAHSRLATCDLPARG